MNGEQSRNHASKFDALLKTTLEGYWLVDSDARFLDVNEPACALSGYTREEMLRMSIMDIEVIESAEETRRHVGKLRETGYDRFETRHRRKDGRIIDVEAGRAALVPATFCLPDFLEKLETDFRTLCETKGLGLKVEPDPSLPVYVIGDREKLGRIFENLLDNAVKFTEHGVDLEFTDGFGTGSITMNNKLIQDTVMIVDDTPANLKLLAVLLQGAGHRVVTFPRGDAALKAAAQYPPDIILLDINMPEMNGFEVCKKLKADKTLKDIPVLFISAISETADKVRAFAVGGVDYVTKPFQLEEVQARVKTHLTMRRMRVELEKHNLSLEQLVREKIQEIYDAQVATIFALAKLAENRDNDTGKHVERVQSYTKLLAENMRESHLYAERINDEFVTNLYHATPLHDIGKVAIADNILLKPAELTPEEFEIMKTHTVAGVRTLETVHERYPKNAFLAMGVALTRSHHERWDGRGYPDGLAGEAIPLAGRIMAAADVYDALRSKRVYKPPFSHQKTCEIIIADTGKQFDPGIIDVFIKIEKEFNAISKRMDDVETE